MRLPKADFLNNGILQITVQFNLYEMNKVEYMPGVSKKYKLIFKTIFCFRLTTVEKYLLKLFCPGNHLPCFPLLGGPPAYFMLNFCKFIKFRAGIVLFTFENLNFQLQCDKRRKKNMLNFIHLFIEFKVKQTKLKFRVYYIKYVSKKIMFQWERSTFSIFGINLLKFNLKSLRSVMSSLLFFLLGVWQQC